MIKTCVNTWNSDHHCTWQQPLKLLLWKTTAPARAERSESKVQGLPCGWKVAATASTAGRVSNDLLLRQPWLLGCDKGWEMCRCYCYAENRQVLELSECLNEKSANLDSHLEGTFLQQSRHTAGEIEEGELSRCHIAGMIHFFNARIPWRCWENFWLVSKHHFFSAVLSCAEHFCSSSFLPAIFSNRPGEHLLSHLVLCWSTCLAEF